MIAPAFYVFALCWALIGKAVAQCGPWTDCGAEAGSPYGLPSTCTCTGYVRWGCPSTGCIWGDGSPYTGQEDWMQLSQPVSESIACGIASFPGYPLWGWTVRMKCQCSAACGSGRFLHCTEIVNSCCHPPLFQGVIISLLHEIRNCGINIVCFLSMSKQVAPALVGVPLQALPIPSAAPVRRK